MNRIVLITVVLTFAAALPSRADLHEVLLHGDSVVRFATLEESVKLLGERDVFIQSMSRFDRQSRLGVAGEPTEDELLRFVTAQAVAWDDKQIAFVTKTIESIRGRLERLKILFPRTVLFVQTTGKDEGEAAYCRSNAVILPQRLLKSSGADFERLVIHELFHIVSRHAPELRKSLYAVVGFHACHEIPLPADLARRKITNPDAPNVDCYIELKVDGRTLHATPILFSSEQNYDAEKGGSFFRSMQFRLLVIERSGDRWQPALKDQQPELLDPKKTPAYQERIGGNTGYIIHPDEILADNFMHLVLRTATLPTPKIVDDMRTLLSP